MAVQFVLKYKPYLLSNNCNILSVYLAVLQGLKRRIQYVVHLGRSSKARLSFALSLSRPLERESDILLLPCPDGYAGILTCE